MTESISEMVKLHNLRVFEPEISAIQCLAFDHKHKMLALSRADSSIEIWSVYPTPRLQRRLVPEAEWCSVESIAWYGDRLFSCGLHGYVIEHDIQRLNIKSTMAVVSGACWCIDVHTSSNQIAAGTEEGYISLLEINSEGLVFNRIMDKQEGRVLCVSWSPDGRRLASGSQDAVRVWDVSSGHALHRISTGRDQPRKECIVWCVQCIDNNTFVSGDSRGKLCFWDLQMGVSLETHQAMKLDVLCLNVTPDKKFIYCSGMEATIPIYCKLNAPAAGARTNWVRSFIRRFHTHDVRAVVSLGGSKLASGGVDTALLLSEAPPRKLLSHPHLPLKCVSVAHDARVLLTWHATYLELFRLSHLGEDNHGGQEAPPVLLRLDAKPGHNITCAAISEQANWLAYSTQNQSRFFTLESIDGISPVLEKVRTAPRQLGAFTALAFASKEAKKAIVATTEGSILVLGMNHQAASISLSHTISTEHVFTDMVSLVALSADKRFIVASDVAGNTASWSDKKWQRCLTLPKHSCEVTAMAIHPDTNDLMLIYADHKLCEYSLLLQTFTEFSRSLPKKSPKSWFNSNFPITNISFDPGSMSGVLLHDQAAVYVLDKEAAQEVTEELPEKKGKYHRKSMGGVQVLDKYKHVLHAEWLHDRELCVVRVSDSMLEDKLPPAVIRKTFGSHI